MKTAQNKASAERPTTDFLKSTGFLISRVSQLIRDDFETALQPFGVRLRDYRVLQLIEFLGPQSQQRIGELLRIDRTTMVAIVDALESKQLVTRVRDEADRRRYAVSLTDAGRALLSGELAEMDREVTEKILAPLPSAERRQLNTLLWKIVSQDS